MIKNAKEDRLFNLVNYIILAIVLVVICFPLLNIVARSFSSMDAVISGRVWLWPVDFNLLGYESVFENRQVWMGYLNSIIYALLGTSINVSLTVSAAYALSRKDFKARGFVMTLFIITMMFNGGLIPMYILVKNLGMINKRWALLLPNAIVVYNVIVTRTFFQTTIPDELLEASQLDGCSDFRFFLQIVLPLSGPILAVISLWYAVSHWNSYFSALIYIRKESLFPLQIILRNILLENKVDNIDSISLEDLARRESMAQLLKYSLIIVASVPMLILYPFIQKYFVKGVMIGSVKG